MAMTEVVDRENRPVVSPRTVAMGVDRARALMIRVIRNEKVGARRLGFGPGVLQALHRQVLFYFPGWAGQFRADDDTRVGGKIPTRAVDLGDKVYLFERWLGREVSRLSSNPEDLYGALRVASAAHYGLVAELHPFNDGNGRVARVLMNGILMTEAREARFYGRYILPVPILRDQIDEDEVSRMLMEGKEPRMIPYLRAIKEVNDRWVLNPFEVLIASRWIQSMETFLRMARQKVNSRNWKKFLTPADLSVVEKMEEREVRLKQFIDANTKGVYHSDVVPDYFVSP